MKPSGIMLALFVGLSLIGCGGAELEPTPVAPPEEVATHSQFATCIAICNGNSPSVSCSGTTCSSTNGQGVTCDGVFTACAPPSCSGLPACSAYGNQPCFRNQVGTTMACCTPSGQDALLCGLSSGSPTGARWLYF